MDFWQPNRLTPSSNMFELRATLPVCAGNPGYKFLMGGVGMATSILAAQDVTKRPLLWATIQFVASGPEGSLVSIEVEELSRTKNMSLVGVSLMAKGKLIQKLSAALGGRDGFETEQFLVMPDVLPPDACPVRPDVPFSNATGLPSQFERRRAFLCPETGVEYMWTRPNFETAMSAALLAITSDFILGAHPISNGSMSVDNTLRIFSVKQTEWILCVTQMSGVINGITHGTMHQFAQDGTLLSTSSQTGWVPRR